MIDGHDTRRLLACIRELYATLDIEAIPQRLVDIGQRLVSADIVAYNEFNLGSGHLTSLSNAPELEHPDSIEAWGRWQHEHPCWRGLSSFDGTITLRLSDYASPTQLHKLSLYNEFYRPLDVESQLIAAIQTAPDSISTVAWSRDAHDFGDDDVQLIQLLAPHIAQAYRNAHLSSLAHRQRGRLHEELIPDGIVTVSMSGIVRLITPRAHAFLNEFFGPMPRHSVRLQPALWRWVSAQIARLSVVDAGTMLPLAVTRGEVTLMVYLLPRLAGDAGGGEVALFLRTVRNQWRKYAKILSLTDRQGLILSLVAQGMSNENVAAYLRISVNTVRTHLQNIYRRMGVSSRTEAVSRVRELMNTSD